MADHKPDDGYLLLQVNQDQQSATLFSPVTITISHWREKGYQAVKNQIDLVKIHATGQPGRVIMGWLPSELAGH